jgi:hypothetical protein
MEEGAILNQQIKSYVRDIKPKKFYTNFRYEMS